MKSMVMMAAALAVACSAPQPDAFEGKVANGADLAATERTEVARIFVTAKKADDGQQTEGGNCTGTFVSPTTMITAAHCLLGKGDQPSVLLDKADGSLDWSKIGRGYAMPRYANDENAWFRQAAFDAAVVVFPSAVATQTGALATTPAKKGDDLEIIGFGHSGCTNHDKPTGDLKKRRGTNVVKDIDAAGTASAGMILLFGEIETKADAAAHGKNVVTCPGDSGGPLFIGGKLAGIVSGGGIPYQGTIPDGRPSTAPGFGVYANVFREDVIAFFEETVRKGAVIPGLDGLKAQKIAVGGGTPPQPPSDNVVVPPGGNVTPPADNNVTPPNSNVTPPNGTNFDYDAHCASQGARFGTLQVADLPADLRAQIAAQLGSDAPTTIKGCVCPNGKPLKDPLATMSSCS